MRTYHERVCIFNPFVLHVPHYRRKQKKYITNFTVANKAFIVEV